MTFGHKMSEKLISLGLAKKDTIIGCSTEEIEKIKAAQNINDLPSLYNDYLLAMGHRAGELFVGTDCFYPTLLKLKKWSEELLNSNGNPITLSSDAFVFSMHQGYEFHYFQTHDANPDPIVYFFTEDPDSMPHDNKPIIAERNLSIFLTDFIRVAEGEKAQKKFLEELGIRIAH